MNSGRRIIAFVLNIAIGCVVTYIALKFYFDLSTYGDPRELTLFAMFLFFVVGSGVPAVFLMVVSFISGGVILGKRKNKEADSKGFMGVIIIPVVFWVIMFVAYCYLYAKGYIIDQQL